MHWLKFNSHKANTNGLESRLHLLVKVKKRYCNIKKDLMEVIIFITSHLSIVVDYCYKELIEMDANLAFSI